MTILKNGLCTLVITGTCTFSASNKEVLRSLLRLRTVLSGRWSSQIHLAAILIGDLHPPNYRIWSSNHSPLLLDSLNIYFPFSGKTLSKPFSSKYNPLPFPTLKALSSDNLVPYSLMSLDFWEKKKSPVWKWFLGGMFVVFPHFLEKQSQKQCNL